MHDLFIEVRAHLCVNIMSYIIIQDMEHLLVRDLVSWSSIMSSHVQNGNTSEGVEPDSVNMHSVAEAYGELGLWRPAKSVHGYAVRKGIQSAGSLDNSLITMYGKCGDLRSAKGLFNNVVHQSTATWTAMITCYNQCGVIQKF